MLSQFLSNHYKGKGFTMYHFNNLTGSNNKQSNTGKSFHLKIIGLAFYSVLCLLQVLPVEQMVAQNYLDNVGLPTMQAVGAYSVRKLSSTYNGPAMQVRRVDNLTANVAFDASNIVSGSSVVTLQVTSLSITNLAPYPALAGTLTVAANSINVIGSGTSFTSQVPPGSMLIDRYSGKPIGIVASVTNNTSLTLVSNTLAATSNRQFGVAAPTQIFSTFYAATSCFVTTWFDQSGYAGTVGDAIQTTLVKQPRIINAGSFELNGTRPGIYFNSSASQTLAAPFTNVTVSYPITMSILANDSGLSNKGAFLRFGGSLNSEGVAIGVGDSSGTLGSYGKSVIGYRPASGSSPWSFAFPDARYPSTPFTSTTTQTLNSMKNYLNGTSIPLNNSSSPPSHATIAGGLFFGGVSSTANLTTIKESEVIVFGSRLSTLLRQSLECNQQLYFNVLTATVGATQNICADLTSYPLGGNIPSFGLTGRWSQVSGPGTTTFSNITSGSSTATASQAGAYVYQWIVSNGTCTASANIMVNFSSAASTGIDQNVCGSLISDALGANIPAIGAGQWTIVTAPVGSPVPAATFSDPNSPNAIATGSVYGSYVFRWSIVGGTCSPSFKDINVTFNSSTAPPPTAVISGNASTCPGGSTTLSVALGGSGPWNLSYSDGTDIINVGGILSSPYTFSVSPTVTTTYKILGVTDQYCKASLNSLTATVVVSVAPIVNITADYCSLGNGKVKLSADNHSHYLWSNGATTQVTSVTQSGFYSVKVDNGNPACPATTSISIGEELVYNGDFEQGISGVSSDYTRATVPMSACASGGLYLGGYYDVLTNPQVDHCNFFGKDHTTGTGNFMAINGASDTLAVWKTNSITVKKNTRYYFSAWGMSLNATPTFAALRFKMVNTQSGATYQIGSTAVLYPGAANNTNNGWQRFSGFWDSGDTTDITISIVNINTAAGGNDFGLDDISFSTLPTFTLSVTGAAVAGPNFCKGESVDLLPTVVGGWSPLSYAWTYASGSSTVEKPNIPSITTADNTINLTVTDGKGCQASAPTINLIITTDTWIGQTTDWYDPNNWTCGVPDNSKDVIIPNVVSPKLYPIINSGVAAVKDLTIGSSAAQLKVISAKLQIAGVVNNSGTFDANQGAIEFNGLSPQAIKGSWFKNNSIASLIASNINGITISSFPADSLNILDSLAFGVPNVDLNTGDNLILASTATRTARVADITGNGSLFNNAINGKVTVQRYFPALRAWRLVTSPLSNTGSIYSNWQNNGVNVAGKGVLVTGPSPSSANGLDISPQNSASLKTGSILASVLDTKTLMLSNSTGNADNIGYFLFVRGDRNPANTNPANSNVTTLSSKGNLQTGTQTFNVPSVARTFSLVGNPYASPVDFSTLTRNNISNRFYVWDPHVSGSSGVGGYVQLDDPYNTGTYSLSILSPGGQDKIIQSSQAFFVETDIYGGTSSLVFNEVNKDIKNNLGMFRPSGKPKVVSFRITLAAPAEGINKIVDGALVEFYPQASPAIGPEDGLKFNNTNESVSLLRATRLLSIERRPPVTSDDTLFIQFARAAQRSYQWTFTPTSLDPLLTAYLEDSYTGKKTALSITANSTYDFVVNGDAGSSAVNRFRIVFKKAGGVLPVTYKSIRAYKKEKDIAVEWSVENEININRYEVEKSADGISFAKVNTTAATRTNGGSVNYNWLDTNPFGGNNFYRIRNVSPDGKFEYSNIVVVKTMQSATAGIKIYPNPVTNGIIGTEFKNMDAGIYDISLLNNLGQSILSKTINHAAGSSLENIQPGFKLAAGIYQLKVTSPDQEITTVKVIVQ
ncbi:MAG: T9SS type A sorting domain-containing protein [Ferruginibacter sp.]